MRAEIRRIDLTAEPIRFETWTRLDTSSRVAPVGRSGLWDAMAHAVSRAREASVERELSAAPWGTPHLAYLARVAAASASIEADGPGAEVVALHDGRRSA